jgi:hypothetical protein
MYFRYILYKYHQVQCLSACQGTKAQEQQREKELAQRLKRRASARASFSAASLTAFAARRFSAAVGLRQHARLPGTTELTGESKKGWKSRWLRSFF